MNLSTVLVVYKRSAYELYCEQERDPRILKLFAEDHFTIHDMRRSHAEHRETMERVGSALESLGIRSQFVHRAEAVEPVQHDLVITVGGDGTFLETSHHVRDTPMLGVNSSPTFSVGVFCGATGKTMEKTLQGVRKGTVKPVTVNRVGILLNGTPITEPVLNEVLVAAQNAATTARYVLEVGRRREDQKSSGIYLGPAAGSTAVIRSAGGKILPLSSKGVQYVVREPYRAPGRKYALVRGLLAGKTQMRVHSKMRNGMIFIDGSHIRYRFDYGDELEVVPQFVPLTIYGLVGKRRG